MLAELPGYGPWMLSSRNNASPDWSMQVQSLCGLFPVLIAVREAGALLTAVDGSEQRLPADQLIYLEPGSKQCLRIIERQRFAVLHFCPCGLHPQQNPRVSLEHKKQWPCQQQSEAAWGVQFPTCIKPFDGMDRVLAMIEMIARSWWQAELQFESDCRLAQVLVLIRNSLKQTDQPRNRAEAIIAYMDSIRDRLVTIEDIQRHFNVSYNTLNTLTQQHYQCTAAQLLRTRRLEHAAHLLETGYSRERAAQRCSYRSVDAFSRAFSRHFGCSPQQWVAQSEF